MKVASRARRSVVLTALMGLFVVSLTACRPASEPTPSQIVPGVFALPVANWQRDGETVLCAGGGFLDAHIHGSAADPMVVWVDNGGQRLRLAWPAGYTAVFAPSLEVHDGAGAVAFREGDRVEGGCETADRGVWSIV